MVPNVLKDQSAFVFRVKQSKKSLRLFVTVFISNCTESRMSCVQVKKSIRRTICVTQLSACHFPEHHAQFNQNQVILYTPPKTQI